MPNQTPLLRSLRHRVAAHSLVLSALAPLAAAAQDVDAVPARSPWAFAGYGSAGVVHSNERAADFTANVLNPGRAGRSRAYSYDVDSRLAAQVDLTITPHWSAVLQVVSERNLDHDFAPVVEWANVAYRYSPELSVRVGRIAMPIFLVGDYRKASYALPWVRPPVEVYSALPLSSSDGIDMSYRWHAGAAKSTLQFSFGHAGLRVSPTAHAYARQMVGLSNSTTIGFLTVRASVMTTTLTTDLAKPLFDALRQVGPAGAALARQYDVDSKRTAIAAAGFNYDPGSWFVMGELGRFNARSYLGDKTVGYVSGGYRYGDLTPYLTYSHAKANQSTVTAGLPLAGLPPQLAQAAATVNAQLASLLRGIAIQHTVGAGVRWDFMRDRSLKLQVDQLHPEDGSKGTLINPLPAFRSGHAVTVVSAMLDFVF
jgi:hypothetical protein